MSHSRKTRAALLVTSLLAALCAAVGAPTAAQAAASTCSTTSTKGTVLKTVWAGWQQGFRSYLLHVPAGLTGDAPLLVDSHGLGSNAVFQEITSGWSTYADAQKFIVAYPAGSAWGQAWQVNQGSPDVTFIRKVVEDISSTYCVDDARVFAEGGSLGGFMTQRLLCDAEDVFASGVSTISSSADYFGGTCDLSRPVAMGVVNSESDPLFDLAQSKRARDYWLAKNDCSSVATPEVNAYGANASLYADCDGDAQVLWRTYVASGHNYPTAAALDDIHARTWSFLMAHPRP